MPMLSMVISSVCVGSSGRPYIGRNGRPYIGLSFIGSDTVTELKINFHIINKIFITITTVLILMSISGIKELLHKLKFCITLKGKFYKRLQFLLALQLHCYFTQIEDTDLFLW